MAQWELERELNLLEFDTGLIYMPFNLLSHGQQTKILLATLFLKPNAFLLIDEPTNHLDTIARKAVAKYLQSKSGFILVSHDRTVLDECVDHIISINRADIDVQQGNFSTWEANKELQDNFELSQNERLKRDINRLKQSAKEKSAWSTKTEKGKKGKQSSGLKADKGYVGHKAAKIMQLSKNIETRQNRAISDKSKLLKNLETADDLKLSPLVYPKQTLVEAMDLSISYDGNTIFDGLNFSIQNGDQVALIGKNGCGKSSVIKLLFGESITHGGTLNIGSNLKISYVSQTTSHLKGDLRDYADGLQIDESLFKSILRKLSFERSQFDKNIEDYSEGQKKKVLLAGSLCEQAHLYIWDEPLNFIDVLSHGQIENLVLKYKPTILFVEHDTSFTERIATKKVEFLY
ncbi:Lsa family ABC-F type ribosomal protection protein [Clostridia bacterium]|nr:Lsa family ABC-F type ribosomal protection protein [Clostridia bacterium]